MKYAVNEEGVTAMRTMSNRLRDALEAVDQITQTLRSEADAGQNVLGPHKPSLDDALDCIDQSVRQAAEPAEEICDTIDDVAEAYEEIISNDRLRSGGIGAVIAGIGAAIGGVFGGKGGSGGSGGNAGSGGSGSKGGGSFEGMPTGKLENGMTVLKGDHFEQFLSDYYSETTFASNGNDLVIETVSPSCIEGVHLGDTEASDPGRFWGMHNSSKEFFTEAASHIPAVQAALDGGASLESLINDPELGTCASIYFDPKNMPRVEKFGDYYTFDTDGRHRIIAARELGYDIPVRIVGERSRK